MIYADDYSDECVGVVVFVIVTSLYVWLSERVNNVRMVVRTPMQNP